MYCKSRLAKFDVRLFIRCVILVMYYESTVGSQVNLDSLLHLYLIDLILVILVLFALVVIMIGQRSKKVEGEGTGE